MNDDKNKIYGDEDAENEKKMEKQVFPLQPAKKYSSENQQLIDEQYEDIRDNLSNSKDPETAKIGINMSSEAPKAGDGPGTSHVLDETDQETINRKLSEDFKANFNKGKPDQGHKPDSLKA